MEITMTVTLILEAEGECLECDACGRLVQHSNKDNKLYITTAGELEEVTEVRCQDCFKNDQHDVV